MATPSWRVNGQYYETCSCDFVCPCVPGQIAVAPSKGSCTFAMGFQIERGSYGTASLDGLGFLILGWTPEAMGKGNWSVGLVIDDRAGAEQREAITAIASGAAGGPMAALSGLIGTFLGVEAAAIRFDRDGRNWSVTASNLVAMAASAAMGVNTWAAFAGSDEKAVVDGDFAMLESELQGVLKALRHAGIAVVAIHHHMTHEEPRILFLHYWGVGRPEDLAKGLRAALAQTSHDSLNPK